MPPKPSTSKSKPPHPPKPKESEASKAEKRKQVNAHKAAKAAAMAKVDVAELDGVDDSDRGEDIDEDKDADEEEVEEKEEEKWYCSKCGGYIYIRDTDGKHTRWLILAKPNPKDDNGKKNWSIAEYMELTGTTEKDNIYNAIITYTRTVLMAEVKDLENPKWADVNTDMRKRVNYKVKKRFPYLNRFKDNCVTEEMSKRILRNRRDTKARIVRAGGQAEYKALEKAKRKARKTKAIERAVANSEKKRTPEVGGTPQGSEDETGSSGKRDDIQAKEVVNGKGKKRAVVPIDDEDDQRVFSDEDQPRVSIQKRRRIVNDSDLDELPEPPRVPNNGENVFEVTKTQSEKRKSTSEDQVDENVLAYKPPVGVNKQPSPNQSRAFKRPKHAHWEMEKRPRDGDEDEEAVDQGEDEQEDKGAHEEEAEEEVDEDKDNDESEGEEYEDEEELKRKMEVLQSQLAAVAARKKVRKQAPNPAARCEAPHNLIVIPTLTPPVSSTLTSSSPVHPTIRPSVLAPHELPPISSTVVSSTPPRPEQDNPPATTIAPEKIRPRPKMRPVPIETDSAIVSSMTATKSQPEGSEKESQPPVVKNPTPPTKGKAPVRPGNESQARTKATSRKVKEELINNVDAASSSVPASNPGRVTRSKKK